MLHIVLPDVVTSSYRVFLPLSLLHQAKKLVESLLQELRASVTKGEAERRTVGQRAAGGPVVLVRLRPPRSTPLCCLCTSSFILLFFFLHDKEELLENKGNKCLLTSIRSLNSVRWRRSNSDWTFQARSLHTRPPRCFLFRLSAHGSVW